MNKIKIVAFLLAALMLTGCQAGNNQDAETIPEETTEKIVLKWGVEGNEITSEVIDALNQKLADDGYNFSVDFVQLGYNYTSEKVLCDLILDFEKDNGSLDIASAGSDWVDNKGRVYDFINNGYYEPLDYKNTALVNTIPDKLWEAVKVDGEVYTIPCCCLGNKGITIVFNTKYITEQQIAEFDGTLADLDEILSGVEQKDDFTPLYYSIDYLDYYMSSPLTAIGSIILNNETMSAQSPYDNDNFLENARTLNSFYKKGYINHILSFSDFSQDENWWVYESKLNFAVFVGCVSDSTMADNKELKAVTMPLYLDTRISGSTGIAKNSQHKEEALKLLELVYTNKEYGKLLGAYDESVTCFSTGLPNSEDLFADYKDVELSAFAGFSIPNSVIRENKPVADLCQALFDELCKADDFDAKLAEIKATLKENGIDDYVADVNALLENNNES